MLFRMRKACAVFLLQFTAADAIVIKKMTDKTNLSVRKSGQMGAKMIPKDPVMLLSFMNLKLRDYYKDLEELCADLDIDQEEISEKLQGIDYHYDRERNQFV